MAGQLLILGAGGHGRAVADLAVECGWGVAGFTDHTLGPGVLGKDDDIGDLIRAGKADAALVGLGNTALGRRSALFDLLRAVGATIPTLVHPRASVSRTCRLGAGTVVFAGVVLGAAVDVGDNVVLYSNAVAEHDCRIAAHAYVSPGVILTGAVTVEESAFIGAGAVLLPGITVGARAIVAAGAVVTGGVQAGVTVLGSPARPTASKGDA
jgi:sugar O-acyltransferase (sialic acid O-acetyltransferase NeuD family)